ncbi:hypothetical protein [Aliamphritea spongicola]|nr:hypothetical protein [Aliamphritea spongicola]
MCSGVLIRGFDVEVINDFVCKPAGGLSVNEAVTDEPLQETCQQTVILQAHFRYRAPAKPFFRDEAQTALTALFRVKVANRFTGKQNLFCPGFQGFTAEGCQQLFLTVTRNTGNPRISPLRTSKSTFFRLIPKGSSVT